MNQRILTHLNYVIEFSDGSIKIGVTKRPNLRIAEIRRLKMNRDKSLIKNLFLSNLSTQKVAFEIEKNMC